MRIIHAAAIAVVLGAVTAPGCFFSPEETYPGDVPGTGTEACEPAVQEACYTGPAGTERVGRCLGGTRTCSADGKWGACEGEVVPAAEENCATADDEDCDGAGWYADGALGCVCEPGTTQDCYTGPAGSDGVGICKAGTGTCNADGRTVDCQGEVLPAPVEDCTNDATDDNCDGTPCNGDVLWAIAASGSGSQLVYDLAVDGSGNVIVVGEFNGQLTLGGITLSSEATDAFILKLASDGKLVWARQVGPVGEQRARTVAVDTDGNIYVAGEFADKLIITGLRNDLSTTAPDDFDLFVLKLSPEGNLVWVKDYGDDNNQFAGGIAATGTEGVALTGWFGGRLNFGGGNLDTLDFDTDIYIAQLHADGDHGWSHRLGDLGLQAGTGIAVGNDAYLAGYLYFQINESGGADIDGGFSSDALVMRRSLSTGAHVWAKDFGQTGDVANQSASDIAVDSSSKVLMTGKFGIDINFGGTDIDTSASPGGFLVKLNSNGAHLWSKAFGSAGGFARGRGVAADAEGNVLITGEFNGTVNFGGGDLTSSNVDVCVAKLTPDGSHTWSRRFGDEATQTGAAIAADPDGDVLIAGTFQGSMVLGNTTVTANNGGADQTLFIAKLAR